MLGRKFCAYTNFTVYLLENAAASEPLPELQDSLRIIQTVLKQQQRNGNGRSEQGGRGGSLLTTTGDFSKQSEDKGVLAKQRDATGEEIFLTPLPGRQRRVLSSTRIPEQPVSGATGAWIGYQ